MCVYISGRTSVQNNTKRQALNSLAHALSFRCFHFKGTHFYIFNCFKMFDPPAVPESITLEHHTRRKNTV